MINKKDKIAEEAEYIEVEKSSSTKRLNWRKLIFYFALLITIGSLVALHLSNNLFSFNKTFSFKLDKNKDNQKFDERLSDLEEEKDEDSKEKIFVDKTKFEEYKIKVQKELNLKFDQIFRTNNFYDQELEFFRKELKNLKNRNSQQVSDNSVNLKFLLLLIFQETFEVHKINKFSKTILELFPDNNNIRDLLDYLRRINNPQATNSLNLVERIDDITKERFFFYDKSYEMLNGNLDEKTSMLEIFFLNLLSSNFRVTKVDNDENLEAYVDKNADGKFDYIDSLIKIKNYLILGDVKKIKNVIREIQPPISSKLENLIFDIEQKIEVEENYKKLKTIILNEIIKEIEFD